VKKERKSDKEKKRRRCVKEGILQAFNQDAGAEVNPKIEEGTSLRHQTKTNMNSKGVGYTNKGKPVLVEMEGSEHQL